jgi:hypothetical protein
METPINNGQPHYEMGMFAFPAVHPLDEHRCLLRGGVLPPDRKILRSRQPYRHDCTNPDDQTRRCYDCKERKPFTDFYHDYRDSHGRQRQCKPCMLARQAACRAKKKGAA